MSDNPDVPPSKPLTDEQNREFLVTLLDGATLTNGTTGEQLVRVDGQWVETTSCLRQCRLS